MMMMMIFTKTARLCPPSVFLSPQKTHTVILLSRAFRVFVDLVVCALRSLFWRSSDERKKSLRGDLARVESSPIEEKRV